MLIVFVVSGVLGGITASFSTSDDAYLNPNAATFSALFSPMEIILNIVALAVGYIFNALLMRGALDETEGTKFALSAAFSRLEIVPIIILGILLSIGTTIGIILCVLPGIVFAVLTMFAMVFLVDQKLSPIESIKASYNLVTSKLGESILTVLVLAGVTILGFLACCVGLLVAMPVTQIAYVYAYRRLQGQPVA